MLSSEELEASAERHSTNDSDLVDVQRQLEALQGMKQAFLQDLTPLPNQTVPAEPMPPPAPSLDVQEYLKEASQVDQALHYEYCALHAQAGEERRALVGKYGDWQAEDAKRLADIAHKRRAVQAAFIAEREATLVRDYEEQLARLQTENTRLRELLTALQSGRRPDLGFDMALGEAGGPRGVVVSAVTGDAMEAGAAPGDVVVGVGWHTRVDTPEAFEGAVARVRPGDLVTVDAFRHRRPITFHIVAKVPSASSGAGPNSRHGRASHADRRLFCYAVGERGRAPSAGPPGRPPPAASWAPTPAARPAPPPSAFSHASAPTSRRSSLGGPPYTPPAPLDLSPYRFAQRALP